MGHGELGLGSVCPLPSPRRMAEWCHQTFRCCLLFLESPNAGTDVMQLFILPQIREETVKANMPQVSSLIMASTLRIVSLSLASILG